MKRCWNCNKELAENATSCPHCGVTTSKEAIRQMATIGPGGPGIKQIVVGATIADRYEIRRELGRGGMGIVYLAYDKTMAREVALKIIPQELCLDPRAVADLKRETGIALNLTHEHIVRLYNLDLWEGQAFVTMEYVSGGTLAHLLAKKERYTLPEILPLLQQMAEALDYSHAANPAVIHRDLKPLNVLLTEDGRIKIADFGLARVLRDSASRVSGHESAGTLAYMAPEQVRGKGIGRKTDLYALAAITYELLCGHPPFYTGDLRWQILHEEVEPIEGVSEHINQVLARALDKEGSNRPASAAEFVKLLSGAETATREKPIQKSQPQKQPKVAPTAKGAGTPPRPPKLIFAAITTLFLVALAASGWFFQGSGQKSQVEIKQSQPVNLAATLTPSANKEKLPMTSGSLSITSDPDGAQVIIDGKKVGITPLLSMKMAKGSHQVEITKDTYKPWARKVTITADSSEEIKVSLEKSSEDAASVKPSGQEPASSKDPPTYTDPTTGMELDIHLTNCGLNFSSSEIQVFLESSLVGDTGKIIKAVIVKEGQNEKQRFEILEALGVDRDESVPVDNPDINFDGYPDLEIITFPAKEGQAEYYVWDQKTRGFQSLGLYSKFRINQQEKTLKTEESPTMMLHIVTTYKFVDGKLTKISEKETEAAGSQ